MEKIRIWQCVNNQPVKLTLHKDVELHHHTGCYTDEGYKSEETCWSFDGTTVVVSVCNRERDCDGPHESFYDGQWSPGQETRPWLTDDRDQDGNWIADDSIQLPEFQKISSSQRDYYAESMNY